MRATAAEHLVHSNVWIAGGAAALWWMTTGEVGAEMQPWHLLLPFGATLAGYSALRFMGRHQVTGSRSTLWMRSFPIGSLALMGLGGLLAGLVWLVGLNAGGRLWTVVAIAIFALYAVPVWRGHSLRELPFMKTVVVAVVWTLLTVWVPRGGPDLSPVSLERFLLILGLTLPFDVKDRAADEDRGGHINVALAIGVRATRWLSVAVLGAGLFTALWHHLYGLGAAVVLSYLVAGWLVVRVRPDASEMLYFFGLDAVLVLYPLLVALERIVLRAIHLPVW